MKEVKVARPGLPYAKSAAAIYLTKQIEALSGTKNQREIASEMGYAMPNILSMFKRGESKIPMDRVPAMAKALLVDPAHLLRLVMEQHWPEVRTSLEEIFGRIVSENEFALVEMWRKSTKNSDPKPTYDALQRFCEQLKRPRSG